MPHTPPLLSEMDRFNKHKLAMKAIRDFSAIKAHGSYEEAVDEMLPMYEAAPDMLEALKLCYKVFRMDDVDTLVGLKVGMAISAAEGRREKETPQAS